MSDNIEAESQNNPSKKDNGKHANKKRRDELKRLGMCKIEVYLDTSQKADAREQLNKVGFPTTLVAAVKSAKNDVMKLKREETLRNHFGTLLDSPENVNSESLDSEFLPTPTKPISNEIKSKPEPAEQEQERSPADSTKIEEMESKGEETFGNQSVALPDPHNIPRPEPKDSKSIPESTLPQQDTQKVEKLIQGDFFK